MEKVDEDASPEFKWLKRKGFGGKKKEIQFYESFIYDGVKYMLYDCVYMYKEGLREPYIGKLIKIWEVRDNKTKKVKVQWFFRPEEISKWLGNTTTLVNEIFFASGEGVGLANINLLETIAGRCNVVCVSKDRRNPQPSDEELKAADFVFYRTFDVQSCSILDKMEEKVGGLEIEYVFNRKGGETENTSALPGSTSDRKEENQNTTTTCGEVRQPLNKSLTNKLKDDKEDIIKLSAKVDTKGESQDKDISKKLAEISKGNSRLKEMAFGKDKAGKDEMKVSTVSVQKVEAKERNKPSTGSDKLHNQPSKTVMPDDKNPPKETPVEIEVAGDSERSKDMPSKESKVDNKSPSGYDKLHDRPLKKIKSDEKAAPKEKQVELEAARDDAERLKDMPSKKSKVEKSRKLPVDGNSKNGEKLPLHAKNEKDSKKSDNKTPMGSDNLHDRPLKKIKSDDKTTHKEIQVEVEAVKEAEGLANSVKSPVDCVSEHEERVTPCVNKSYGKNGKVLLGSDKGKSFEKVNGGSFKMPDNKKSNSVQKLSVNTNGSNGKDLVDKQPKVEQPGENKRKLSTSKSPKVADLPTERDKKTMYEEFVVGPKPNAEKSGWFRQLPWDERLKNAYEIGTAVLLYNVDPNYTSRDVEDIIWHALAEHCAAKILQRTAVSSPHYGQALILLKTKEAARRVLAKLDDECLMLSNGRPLVAITCPRILVKKNSNFFGHLAIDKIRLQNQRPMDEAVSTSHFSQPNTIEYDLAMEWCLLQSRSKKWWEMIHKQQGDELKKLKTALPKK